MNGQMVPASRDTGAAETGPGLSRACVTGDSISEGAAEVSTGGLTYEGSPSRAEMGKLRLREETQLLSSI